MSTDFTKKAVEMLLKGATLISDPCPYCKGVRVMKDGNALCVNCGRSPSEVGTKVKNNENITSEKNFNPQTGTHVEQSEISRSTRQILEKKLETLSSELDKEAELEKQQKILKSINAILETLQKLKN